MSVEQRVLQLLVCTSVTAALHMIGYIRHMVPTLSVDIIYLKMEIIDTSSYSESSSANG